MLRARGKGLKHPIPLCHPLVSMDQLLFAIITPALTIGAISIIGTALIGFAIKAALGLRPQQDHEREGPDLANHGEEGYV